LRTRIQLLLVAFACAALVVAAVAEAGTQSRSAKAGPQIRHFDSTKSMPVPVREARQALAGQRSALRRAVLAAETPPVGTTRTWLALDDVNGIYFKDFTLMGVGPHIEIWVADDLLFPAGDCRNGVRTQITQADVDYFVNEFEQNMYPKESAAFAVPPDRDGTQTNPAYLPVVGGDQALLESLLFPGNGERIVTFVDNVRDDNYYDTDNSQGLPYIAGFFWSLLNELGDRNIMSIDAFDWLHRTRANPPNDPSTDLCTSAPARPFLYEGTFAHEYQHLLEYYSDSDEVNWINEGLSDWAQTLTGYVDPSKPITDQDFDSHIQCFLGWNEVQTPANPIPRQGGPENSLTLWGDQDFDNPAEILCDYGAAYTFMELLAGRYGNGFMSALHLGQANGLAGLQEALDAFGIPKTSRKLLREWSVAVALDGVIDDGARMPNRAERWYQVPTLNAFINWDNDDTYDTPGAPPNGSDYVRVRDADGTYLSARQIDSIRFNGTSVHAADPVEWTVDPNPPDRAGNAALYSGSGDNFDRAVIREVAVPAGSPTLTFDTKWDTEFGFDIGVVQISTDGGETWTSLGNEDTTNELDPGVESRIRENLPGFNGTGGWKTTTFDLSAYAGQTVLLSFRYLTDSSVILPGWWIDNVTIAGTLISDGSGLEGWQSLTQVNPIEIAGFTVKLIGYTEDHQRAVTGTLRLNGEFDGRFSTRGTLATMRRYDVTTVAVLVMYDEPTEQVTKYAPYELTVNGALQPGGS
jgi:immune inhibitor InhA-like protein